MTPPATSRPRWGVFLFVLLFLPLLFLKWKETSVPLAERLVSEDDTVRNLSYLRMRGLAGPERTETVEALLTVCRGADPRRSRLALYALRKMGETDERVVEIAIASLRAPDARLRREGAVALMEIGGEALARVARGLSDPDLTLQSVYAEILRRSGSSASGALLSVLTSSSIATRHAAAEILGEIGPFEPAVVEALKDRLHDPDRDTRIAAALSLEKGRTPVPETIGVLVEAISIPWDERSESAARALERRGPSARAALPMLSVLLRRPTEAFGDRLSPRAAAARAAQAIDQRSSEIVDLAWDIQNKDVALRYRAAYFLAESDPPRLGAVPALVRALGDPDVGVASRALHGLSRVGMSALERLAATAYPHVVRVFGRADGVVPGFTEWAAPAIAEIGPPLIPAIKISLQKKEISAASADHLLSRLAPPASSVPPSSPPVPSSH